MMELLIANGANKEARNKFGIMPMHVAAQGDQPVSILILKMLGCSLDVVDNRKSTPLHWACYSQSEISLGYLVAWTNKFD